jgi:V/A-type H+-transporting ATPase subunit B
MRAELSAQGTVTAIEGPLLFLKRNIEAGLNDAVEVLRPDERPRLGRIAVLDQDMMVIEVLESTIGLDLHNTRVRFWGEPLHVGLGPGLLGRVSGSQPTAGRRWLPRSACASMASR